MICLSISMLRSHSLDVSIHIYIYIYAGELVLVPRFSLSRARNSTTSRVRNSTTSWGDHFRTTKIGFFWGFLWQILVPISVFCFLALPQLVTSYFLFIIFPKNCFWQRGKKFWDFFDTVFPKSTIKIGFIKKGPSSQHHQKTCFTNCQLVCHKKCIL